MYEHYRPSDRNPEAQIDDAPDAGTELKPLQGGPHITADEAGAEEPWRGAGTLGTYTDTAVDAEAEMEQPPLDENEIARQTLLARLPGAASPEEPQRYVVPRGWTTLIHGTNTERWEVGETTKTINNTSGLSAITAEDAARSRERARNVGNEKAYDTTASYSDRAQGPFIQPVEVRVLFYREDLAVPYRPRGDAADIKQGLSPETQALINRYHKPRHPVVPNREVLLKIGEEADVTTGRMVEYFVPKSVAEDYAAAVERGLQP